MREDIAAICTFYGEFRQLRRRVEDWRRLRCRVFVFNDGWPDRELFGRIVSQAGNAIPLSRMDDEGFRSHELRNIGMDVAGTERVFMHDLDCALDEAFAEAFNAHDWTTADRWMFPLETPVVGYAPFARDAKKLTKNRVHPNVHVVSSDAARYDSALFGRHEGDEEFFDALNCDYEVFSKTIRMERGGAQEKGRSEERP